MSPFVTWLFSIMAAIMLFLHGLAAFSAEITTLGGAKLRDWLQRVTQKDWQGACFGACATALVQSSSAITAMAVGLAHNKTLSARGALSVMIGANVGTTLTAWLIAFKVTGLGPFFVTIGGLWSLAGPMAWRPYGKPLYYFGIIFLALDLISQALAPLAHHPNIQEYQQAINSPIFALLFAAFLTAMVQSSSVVSGLAVLAVLQQIIPASLAVWMIAGANVGTTSTALLASSALDSFSRKLALLNIGFNFLGVLLFATLLQPIIHLILASDVSASQQVALVHTVFNLAAATVALIILPLIWPRVLRWLQGA